MGDTTFPRDKTLEVAEACLCLHAQRAARALARRFDEVFRPLDLTNGQFSLLMALNRPEPPSVGQLAPFLAMDRTTLTALVKPLARRGLVDVITDPADRRRRRLKLTAVGHSLLIRAYPLWCAAHRNLEQRLGVDPTQRAALLGFVQGLAQADTGVAPPSPESRARRLVRRAAGRSPGG